MEAATEGRLEIRHLGLVPYGEALALQESLRDARGAGQIDDTVLLLEHPDVITFGRGASPQNAPSDEKLRASGFEVFRVNRGGDVTWHGPGQLIGYPLFDLSAGEPDVHVFLRRLEAVLIDTLADFGVAGKRREGYAGVWIDQRRKIASIGVGLRGWLTMHGFALNVCCDLSRFDHIVPCGLHDVDMTSLARELGRDADPDAVARRVDEHLRKVFE